MALGQGSGSTSVLWAVLMAIIVGAVMLVEPIISQIYGCLIGVDNAPGILTYIGGIVTLTGLL